MAKATRDLEPLETALGWQFRDLTLLQNALVHASAREQDSNERLEFLGDRVLGLIMAEALVARFPKASEGELASRFNALVRKEACADVAVSLELGTHLRMARSESMAGGRKKLALVANAMEAVIAAVYLDAGIDTARDVVLKLWSGQFDAQRSAAPIEPKTALQEWAQGRGMPLPRYALISREGPDHAPIFNVRVDLDNGETESANGKSKREAERNAAEMLLRRMGEST